MTRLELFNAAIDRMNQGGKHDFDRAWMTRDFAEGHSDIDTSKASPSSILLVTRTGFVYDIGKAIRNAL